jgi:hypothetical protein
MPAWLGQILDAPVIEAGACILVPIAAVRQLALEVVPHTFTAVTQILPPFVLELTVIELEP